MKNLSFWENSQKKNLGGGGGIFEPKTLSMYLKKEKEKKK